MHITGETLRAWRATSLLTQSQAAARLGISLRQYQRWEARTDALMPSRAILFSHIANGAN